MTMIFVNLPSSNLDRSREFYLALGCTINPQFSDENAASIVWSDEIVFMVLTREFFATFTDKQIADPATTAQTLIGISRDTREEVDAIIEAGLQAGGTAVGEAQDYGFMYQRSIEDPDGNTIEFIYMDPNALDADTDVHMAEQAGTDT